jgi:hypothetical protein
MDLSGLTVAIIGRLARLPLGRAGRELARRGAKVGGMRECDVAVVGQGAVSRLRSGNLQSTLAELKDDGVILLSERALLRVLDVLPVPEEIHREFDCFELARLSRLSMEEVEILTLFDVLDPIVGFFGFADLRLARSCRAALDDGVDIADVAGVAGIMDVRAGLGDVRRDSVGELVLSPGGGRDRARRSNSIAAARLQSQSRGAAQRCLGRGGSR